MADGIPVWTNGQLDTFFALGPRFNAATHQVFAADIASRLIDPEDPRTETIIGQALGDAQMEGLGIIGQTNAIVAALKAGAS